jgi:exosortase
MAQRIPEPNGDEQATRLADAPGCAQGDAAPRAPKPRRSGALLGLAVGLAALAYRGLLFWDPGARGLPNVEWFFFGASDTSPQIVFVLAAGLLFQRRKRLAEALQDEGSLRLGLPLLLAGSLLFLWGHYVGAPDLLLASVLPVTLGAALFVAGRHLAAALALPVLFLAFAIPMPAVLMNQIVFPLQLRVTAHTAWLLAAMGTPVVQEGDVLYLADRTFEVIETCSGLRSIEVLTMLAVAWVCFFPTGRLHGLLLIAAAPVIAYVINAARVTSLVLNPQSELSVMHTVQGIAMFLAGVAALYAIDAALWRKHRRRAARTSEGGRRASRSQGAHAARRARAIALTLLAAALLGASLTMPRWSPPPDASSPPIELPEALDGWQAIGPSSPDILFRGSVSFSKRAQRRYQRNDEVVSVFVGHDDRLQRSRSLLSPKNAFPGRGWHVEDRARIELAPGGPGAPRWRPTSRRCAGPAAHSSSASARRSRRRRMGGNAPRRGCAASPGCCAPTWRPEWGARIEPAACALCGPRRRHRADRRVPSRVRPQVSAGGTPEENLFFRPGNPLPFPSGGSLPD